MKKDIKIKINSPMLNNEFKTIVSDMRSIAYFDTTEIIKLVLERTIVDDAGMVCEITVEQILLESLSNALEEQCEEYVAKVYNKCLVLLDKACDIFRHINSDIIELLKGQNVVIEDVIVSPAIDTVEVLLRRIT